MSLDKIVEKAYAKRFTSKERTILKAQNIIPSIANSYARLLLAEDIVELVNNKITPHVANPYVEKFDHLCIRDSRKRKYEYITAYSGKGIKMLLEQNITPEIAFNYSDKCHNMKEKPKKYKKTHFFNIEYVIKFIKNKLPLEEIREYSRIFYEGQDFSEPYLYWMTYNLILLGVPSSLINSEKSKQNYTSVLYTIAANYMHKYRNTNITYLSTGSEAVIVFDNETKIALKFALAIGAEYNIAKKIINGKNKLPKNVFKCLLNSELENITSNKEDDIREIRLNGKMFIPMEYIKGNSLEQAIVQKGNLEPIKIYKYSAGIMNGLIEMRTARVFYHRDIRPANIMIDEENDRAVIVDLGIATTDKSALSKDNRRFGSVKGKIANDLVSLGQVMYYMATGKHIFEQSESMTRTFSDVAEEIEDYRTKVYSDETGELLKEHLKQVDSEIADEKLRELTIACLTAKHYQYNKINKMFKEYAK